MATDLENLQTRRTAVTVELAALSATAAGGGINYSVDGQSFDHVGYKKSLYDELTQIDGLIRGLEGPYEHQSQGF